MALSSISLPPISSSERATFYQIFNKGINGWCWLLVVIFYTTSVCGRRHSNYQRLLGTTLVNLPYCSTEIPTQCGPFEYKWPIQPYLFVKDL